MLLWFYCSEYSFIIQIHDLFEIEPFLSLLYYVFYHIQQYFNYIIVISVGNQGTQKKVHNLDCKICIKSTLIVDNKIFKP